MQGHRMITIIGGGTGSYTVLRGLKNYTPNLSAIVSMFDSGGSTGILRDEHGDLPKGDVRRCLLALVPEEEDNSVLRSLMQYRFENGDTLKGHSLGNMLLTAARAISNSEQQAVDRVGKILQIRGRVIPVTEDNCHLQAKLDDGQIIYGETNIDVPKHDPKRKIENISLNKPARANPEAVQAISYADTVVIGPGDLYTSVLPNLLVEGIPEALQITPAKVIYLCNVMTKPGETNGFRASQFLDEVIAYIGKHRHLTMVCNKEINDTSLLEKYAGQNQFPVEVDEDEIRKRGIELVKEDLVNQSELARHDSMKLAKTIMRLTNPAYER